MAVHTQLPLLLATLWLLVASAQKEATVASCVDSFQTQLSALLHTNLECRRPVFTDCCQVKKLLRMAPNGLYDMANFCFSTNTFSVASQLAYCDMSTDGGGWLVIQRRLPNGTTNFTRNWQDYENGFGDLEGEFWYGLRNIHCLTRSLQMELRIDMETTKGKVFTWTYQTVRVHGPSSYVLSLGSGSGTWGNNGMSHNSGRSFSTYDRDRDTYSSYNCAKNYEAGWWFGSCTNANLNGQRDAESSTARIWWYSTSQTLQKVEMKIRPTGCASGVC